MLSSLLIVAAVVLAPLIAATVIAARMGRRGMWLIGPWAVAVLLGLAIGFGLHQLATAGQLTTTDRQQFSAVATAWGGAVLISGYLSTLGYLMVLAAVGPRRAGPGMLDVF